MSKITIDRALLEQAIAALVRSEVMHGQPNFDIQDKLRNALAQPQPVQEPVAYLDIGSGGYLDIATNLTDEQLLALPKGRHTLVIAGTFGIDGYTSPQAQPLSDEQIQEAVTQAAKDGNLSWLGFKKDGMGMYTVPDLSPAHYQLARAIEQAHGITKGTT